VVLNLAALLPRVERAGGIGPFLSHCFSGTERLQAAAEHGSEFTVFRIDAGGLAAQFFGGHLPLAPSLLLTLGIVGAVFLLLALWFARTIVKPIEQLTSAAHALKSGDYDKANIAVRANDEVGQLARTFNVMIDVLRQRERERARNRAVSLGYEKDAH
jgi:HAMP domain-containing protein